LKRIPVAEERQRESFLRLRDISRWHEK
jgi:hypothetical protein